MKHKEIKREDKLERVLLIGPTKLYKCHFVENIYDEFKEAGFDVKYLGPKDLELSKKQIAREEEYYLSNTREILRNWKPQMVWIDDCWVLFRNTLSVPVFYNHMAFGRPPMVMHPTVAYFYHEDLITYYNRIFATDWMAQVPHKEVLYVAYNPETWKPQNKKYMGINTFGGREGFKPVYRINEVNVMAEVWIIEQEHKQYKELGLNYFEGLWDDNAYRDMMPQCEALWCNLSMRQHTSRSMLECMATKTLCLMKTMEEEGNHRTEEILAKMGLNKGEHYIGVDNVSELSQAFIETKNKGKMIKDAYNVVSLRHTYKNRMEQIIEKYYEIMKEKSQPKEDRT